MQEHIVTITLILKKVRGCRWGGGFVRHGFMCGIGIIMCPCSILICGDRKSVGAIECPVG